MPVLDCYCTDVQARGAYPAYADSLLKEMGVKLVKEPGDDESLKNIVFDKHKKGFCMRQRHYDYTDIQLLVESIYASKYLSEPQAERLIKILCEFVS